MDEIPFELSFVASSLRHTAILSSLLSSVDQGAKSLRAHAYDVR